MPYLALVTQNVHRATTPRRENSNLTHTYRTHTHSGLFRAHAQKGATHPSIHPSVHNRRNDH